MHVEHFFTALHSAHSLRLEPVFYPRLRSSLYIHNFTYTNVRAASLTLLASADAPRMRPHLLPNCVRFCCCSSIVSTCDHAHTVQIITSKRLNAPSLVPPHKHHTFVTYTHTTQRRLDTVMWHTCVNKFMQPLYGGFCTEENNQNFLGIFFDSPKGIGIIRKR